MNEDKQVYILRTSCNIFNKFSLNNNRLLHEQIKDGEVVSRNDIADNIKEYSAAIDSEDKIHIIYTVDNMELKYLVLPQDNNVINIISANHNLILRCISIKILPTNIHIFYTLTDVEHNYHIICQGSFVAGFWKCSEIFKAFGPRYIQPYLLEIHNREIYILLYLNHFEGKLALFRLEHLKDNWVEVHKSIELKDCSNISFFISPKNMVIIAYNKLLNRNFQTIMIYKSLSIKTLEPWKKRVLSSEDSNTLKPCMFFKKNEYYMTWIQGEEVILNRSKDLISWVRILTFAKYSKEYLKCYYMSNNSVDYDFKMNSAYMSNTINSYPLVIPSFKNEISKEIIFSDNALQKEVIFSDNDIPAINVIEENLELVDNEKSITKALEEQLKFMDKQLYLEKYENNSLKKSINYLNSIVSQYEDNISRFNTVPLLNVDNNVNKIFMKKIISYLHEKDILLFSYNDKQRQLFMLIEEKDKLINELYKKNNK